MLQRVVWVLLLVGAGLGGWCAPAGAATTSTVVALMSSLGGTSMTCPPVAPPTYCQPPVYPGTVVRFSATVVPQSGSGTPTGTVTFFNGSTSLGTVALDIHGTAFVDVTAGSAGSAMSVTATYGGDANFAAAQSGPVGEAVFSQGAVYTPDSSGFILDGWGGLHPWSQGADTAPPVPAGAPYWPGWNIARGLAIGAPMNSCSVEVDGWGGIHQLTWPLTQPAVIGASYWSGWDIVRDVVVMPDCTGGYVLDGWGGLHPFGLGHNPPPSVGTGPYWRGWDIARAAVILPDGSGGYIFDGWGGAHPFALTGNTPPPRLTSSVYFAGADLVRGATIDNRFGVLLVEGSGGTASAALQGSVPPAGLLPSSRLSIPIGEGIAAFGN